MRYIISLVLLLIPLSSFSAQLISYGGQPYKPTYALACQALDDYFTDTTYTALSGTNCIRYLSNGQAYSTYTPAYQAGSCPSGYSENESGFCVESDPCESLANTLGSYYTTQGISSCINGCSTTGVDVCVGSAKIINGVLTTEYSCTATFGASPQSCTGDNSTYDTPQDESCSDTQTEGSFNGFLKCVNADGSIADTRPNVITNENKTTTYDTVDNGDGTSTQTTTTTTTNSDGTTTISTTTTIIDNSTGEVQSEETQTEEEQKQDVYSDNGCNTPVTCEGDVLECASVRQLHELNCKFDVDPSDMTASSLGVDPSLLTEEEGTTLDISDELDTSSFLSSGCPAPRTVPVLQGELTIDYTPFCDLAEIIAPLVLFTASVISLRTVGGAF
ncbi:virulence factor TspB C-terminal domain-related protein [Methylophaga thalassica]|uniref:virulence factor TspB C-terminal domain-related protein n=1 Tax=Methylophaga thalassica TaxID=40223 RepID=UPI002E7BA87E|nr:virulence factor TspB C-terminal domain-related protein [Methylophaga thalassica]WVI84159.1 virulence factor TspB C-terminal domain-related protein [Methylophaga thalassica]